MNEIQRAEYICNQLREKLQERGLEINKLSERHLKRALIMPLPDMPSMADCLAYAEKVVVQIRDLDKRIEQLRAERALDVLEGFAREFQIPSEDDEEEEVDPE